MIIIRFLSILVVLLLSTSCVKKYKCTLTNLSTGEVISETEVNSEAECNALRSLEEARLNNPFLNG